jgi:glyoxylate/hydroxypyruvate reductase A
MQPIVFLHSIDEQEEQLWLQNLKRELATEDIYLAHQLNEQQASLVEVAIVANPDPKQLKDYPNLVWVQSLWAGVEGLVAHFRELNQKKKATELQLVRLIDPQLATSMAEAVLTWTLYLHRNIPEYQAQQQQKIWQSIQYPRAENTRISILGAGELGLSAMKPLLRHGFIVNSWSRSEKNIPQVNCYHGDQLPTMLAQTDILICLLPLTPQTKGLINSELLHQLPKGARLINFARGPIVNDQALMECLDEGQIAHAVLDVFDQEPLPVESDLWQHPKISVLPHISAMTDIETASKVAANNIKTYRSSGEMPTVVDLVKGY